MTDQREIIDQNGHVRRCMTVQNPPGHATKLKAFSDVGPMYTDDQLKSIMTDPNRVRSRQVFDSSWILDQKQHGSCEGHAEAGATQRTRYRRGLPKTLLSGAYAYSKVNGGRDNGAALEDGLVAIQKWGICPLHMVTADMIYPQLQPPGIDAIAAKIRVNVAYALPDPPSLRSALAAGFDVVVCVMVGSRFTHLDGDGVCGADPGGGNHAVCCDDMIFKNGIWLYDMANSWNTTFGQQGRGYLTDHHFTGTFPTNTFYAIASTNES